MELDWGKGDVILADGQEVARANRSWARERAEVQIGPQLWRFRSAGWGSSTLLAELDGTTHYSARRSGLFKTKWTFDPQQLVLRPDGLLSSRMTLWRGDNRVGDVVSSGIFSSRPRLTTTEDLDARAGCFVLWVAYVELNRPSSEAGA